jgi:hypothetical protein
MSTDKLEKVMQKKTPSERRMFFRLLNHFAIEYRKGKVLPPKIKILVEEFSQHPFA